MISFDINSATLLLGVAIFFARILDVSLGTLRVINVVQGRIWVSFILGFIEVLIWLTMFSAIIAKVKDNTLLGVFYALGFASGSVVGIKLEQKMAFGVSVIRLFTSEHGEELAEKLRHAGFAVTVFMGEGLKGPVIELFIVCKRKRQEQVLAMAESIEPQIFYTVEKVSTAARIFQTNMTTQQGWRSFVKKK